MDVSTTSSRGERLLPYLFAVIEACCFDVFLIGLANIHVLGSSMPLLPLWVPFILIAVGCWFVHLCERFRHSSPENPFKVFISVTPLGILAIGMVILALPWLLQLDLNHAIAALFLVLFLCWRGLRLANREIDPAHALKMLRLGIVIILVVIGVQMIGASFGIQDSNEFLLLLLILMFFCLTLLAQSLSHIVTIRPVFIAGTNKDTTSQERRIIQAVVLFNILLLVVALLVVSVASPVTLAQGAQVVDTGYTFIIHILASAIAFILSPILWLLDILHFHSSGNLPFGSLGTGGNGNTHLPRSKPHAAQTHFSPSGTLLTILALLEIIVPLLLLTFIVIMFIKLAQRLLRLRHPVEQRESIWSWPFFWEQLKAFLREIVAFFSRRTPPILKSKYRSDIIEQDQVTIPYAIYDIRVLYRSLLKEAASQGYPRQHYETPFEFELRVTEHLPSLKFQLATITNLYVATRYDEYIPQKTEIEYIHNLWASLHKTSTQGG